MVNRLLLLVLFATLGACVSHLLEMDMSMEMEPECEAVAGVFFNVGENNKDPAKVIDPGELKASLLREIGKSSLRRHPKTGRSISVAIRYWAKGELRFAALDENGNVLETGICRTYRSCSRGVLESRFETDGGTLTFDKKTTLALSINPEGQLVLSDRRRRSMYGIRVAGREERSKFAPNPDLDVRDVDFDWECAREPCKSSFQGSWESSGEVLTALRSLLDRIASGPYGTVAEVDGFRRHEDLLADLLVGVSRAEVLQALGEPEFCYIRGLEDPIVPCSNRGSEMMYRFHRLLQAHLGDGPELHISFSDRGKCETVFLRIPV